MYLNGKTKDRMIDDVIVIGPGISEGWAANYAVGELKKQNL